VNNNNFEHGKQIAAFSQEMLRFARLQLRDQSLSKDATQEAIASALERNNYRADGELRSWLFAILRHKIIDCIRKRSRHPLIQLEHDEQLEQQFKKMATGTGITVPQTGIPRRQLWQSPVLADI
jgi:DNA-directed RNA polymerase specialized sigma24 family protein